MCLLSKQLWLPEAVTGGLKEAVHHLELVRLQRHVPRAVVPDGLVSAHRLGPLDVAHLPGGARLGELRPGVDDVLAQLEQLCVLAGGGQAEEVLHVGAVGDALPLAGRQRGLVLHQAVGVETGAGRGVSGHLLAKEDGRADEGVVAEDA